MWRNKGFCVRVGIYQGSEVSLHIFFLVMMDKMTRNILVQGKFPWCMLFYRLPNNNDNCREYQGSKTQRVALDGKRLISRKKYDYLA